MKKLILVIMMLLGSTSVAQDSETILGLLEGLDDEATVMDTLLKRLEEGDQSVQTTLFHRVMGLPQDSPVREIVITNALASDKKALRSLALWEVIRHRSEMTLQFGPEDMLQNQSVKTAATLLGGGFSSQMFRVDEVNKIIELNNKADGHPVADRTDSLSVSGEAVNFIVDELHPDISNEFKVSGSLKLNDAGDTLIGTVSVYIDRYNHDFAKDLKGNRYSLPVSWTIR